MSSMNQDSLHDAESQPSPKKMRPSPMKSDEPEPKGTLFITVGPQCAGKTTVLKQLFGQSFHKNEDSMTKEKTLSAGIDITIDDQALVYIPVPTSYFLSNATEDAASCTGTYHPSLNETIFGKTIRERILDPSNEELALVAKRLGGELGAGEFALRLRGNAGTGEGGAKTPQDDMIDAVEQVIQQQHASNEQMLPEMIELFVVESIFRPRPLDLLQKLSSEQTVHPNTSALDHALHLLNTTATDPRAHSPAKPLSWGNTNTRPREFKNALEAAANSGRPVEFIVFGGMEACEMIREHVSRRDYRKNRESDANVAADADNETKEGLDSNKEELLCLPKLDRQTLFRRNLLRFCNTGRYIPSNAISDAMVRVESLLASAVAEANKDYPSAESSQSNAKFRLDLELAKMAEATNTKGTIISPGEIIIILGSNGEANAGEEAGATAGEVAAPTTTRVAAIRMTGEHAAIKEGEGATATSSEKRAVGRLDNIKPDQGTGILTGAKIQTEEDLMDAAGAAVVGAVANSVNLSRLLQALPYEHARSA